MREPIRIVPGSDAEAQSTSICCWDSAEPLKLSGNVMSAIAASAKIRARIGSSSFDRRLLTAKDPEPEPSGEPSTPSSATRLRIVPTTAGSIGIGLRLPRLLGVARRATCLGSGRPAAVNGSHAVQFAASPTDMQAC